MIKPIYPFLLLAFLLFEVNPSFAQPVFNQGWAPQAGHVSNNRLAEVPEDTGTGANYDWDFSNLTPLGNMRFVFSFVDPATTPYFNSFPNATIAAEVNSMGSTVNYGYYLEDASAYQTLGSATMGSLTRMTDTQKGICYPMRFGDSFNDTYEYVTESVGVMNTVTASSFNEYDGYGTLHLPQGTFNDVARFVQYRNESDTFAIVQGFSITTITLDTSVTWITPGFSSQLAIFQRIRTIVIESVAGQVDTTENSYEQFFTYDDVAMPGTPSSTQDGRAEEAAWRAYPNPARDRVRLDYVGSLRGEWQFTLVDARGSIVQRLRSSEMPELPFGQLPAGPYWLTIQSTDSERVEQTLPLLIE